MTQSDTAALAAVIPLEEEVDAAILKLNRLTGYGEDAVWRPADAARTALIAAKNEINRLRVAHEVAHKVARCYKDALAEAQAEWEDQRENYIRDVFLLSDAAGVSPDAPEAMAQDIRRIARDRELLLNIVSSLPGHQTSASAMATAYWDWREKMKDAIASARALVAKEMA